MNKNKLISSIQNTLVKKVLLLQEKARERRTVGLFVLEGQREFQLAQKANYQIDILFFCAAIISEETILSFIKGVSSPPEVIEISGVVYRKMAYRETTEGILAVVKTKSHNLEDLQFKGKSPLILVAEAPEKPGNIGALLRTADAANLDAVIIANPKSDLYNPNVIRSSIGCVFTTNIGVGSTSEVLDYLREKDISIYAASLSAAKTYTEIDFTEACAIAVGTESTGLTSEWLNNSRQNVIIPMLGEIDSMNVSVSAAILIFEAKRQRGFIP